MTYREEYRRWLDSGALTDGEESELLALGQDDTELESRFYGPLEFGTAGLRGVMGLGLNRMNTYVIRHVTEAFARVILEDSQENAKKGVAICFDCRNNSADFAREAACVMARNGISVRLFADMRPTPELSFAIRLYGCIAGINITASHNPKEYNGYKVYWSDGAQLPPAKASAIARKMEEIDLFSDVGKMEYAEAVESGLITLLGTETDEAFLEQVMAQAINRKAVEESADRLTIVYTPFHGTGYRLIPEALDRLGIKNLLCVPEQMVVDGNFPTVKSPNPEEAAGFTLAVKLAKAHQAQLIIGTDPDADRVGIMVRNARGEYETISGNRTGVLLLDYLLKARKEAGTLPPNAAVLKSIVTTDMACAVAESYGVSCFDTFTGFKFMAEKKGELERAGTHEVIFSYEESYGYMVGDYVRDKDAVTASVLLAEMAAYYETKHMNLLEALDELFERHGYYGDRTMNLVMPGIDGLQKMKALMARLRERPLSEIAGTKVLFALDYSTGIKTELGTGREETMELSGSNVLRYELEDHTSFIVRPSGTEPKIKVYLLTKAESAVESQERIRRYAAFAETLQ
ncbi:MAG: phospho-sugar mutase [Oscillospiraceae bacterium]|jgi:phosphoglucomutase